MNAVPVEGVRLTARLTGPNAGPDWDVVRWSGLSGSAVGARGGDAGEGAEEALVKLEGRDEVDAPPTVRPVDTG